MLGNTSSTLKSTAGWGVLDSLALGLLATLPLDIYSRVPA